MTKNPNKIKLIISICLLSIIILVGVCIFQLVSINKNRKILDTQNKQISQLQNQINYYENYENTDPDNDILEEGKQ